TIVWRFIAVKLQQIGLHLLLNLSDQCWVLVHEQGDNADKRRHGLAQHTCLIDRHVAFACTVKHKPDRVGSCQNRSINILEAGKTTNFHPSSCNLHNLRNPTLAYLNAAAGSGAPKSAPPP